MSNGGASRSGPPPSRWSAIGPDFLPGANVDLGTDAPPTVKPPVGVSTYPPPVPAAAGGLDFGSGAAYPDCDPPPVGPAVKSAYPPPVLWRSLKRVVEASHLSST